MTEEDKKSGKPAEKEIKKPEVKKEDSKDEDKQDTKKEEKKDTKKVTKIEERKVNLDEIKPGATVRVHQKIKEKTAKGEDKERVQVFEGIILARKHGSQKGATITVRKISEGIGVEKIFPLHSPNIIKIEVVKQAIVRRAKLYYLRTYKKKLKEKKKDFRPKTKSTK
jgi:large subunit ribosomal protein L19